MTCVLSPEATEKLKKYGDTKIKDMTINEENTTSQKTSQQKRNTTTQLLL